jgi:hypothetical protein
MTAINHRLHFFLWEIWETFYRLVNDCCSKETTEEEIYFGPQKAENKLEQMDFICSARRAAARGRAVKTSVNERITIETFGNEWLGRKR